MNTFKMSSKIYKSYCILFNTARRKLIAFVRKGLIRAMDADTINRRLKPMIIWNEMRLLRKKILLAIYIWLRYSTLIYSADVYYFKNH
jgi:hypothetical protein